MSSSLINISHLGATAKCWDLGQGQMPATFQLSWCDVLLLLLVLLFLCTFVLFVLSNHLNPHHHWLNMQTCIVWDWRAAGLLISYHHLYRVCQSWKMWTHARTHTHFFSFFLFSSVLVLRCRCSLLWRRILQQSNVFWPPAQHGLLWAHFLTVCSGESLGIRPWPVSHV